VDLPALEASTLEALGLAGGPGLEELRAGVAAWRAARGLSACGHAEAHDTVATACSVAPGGVLDGLWLRVLEAWYRAGQVDASVATLLHGGLPPFLGATHRLEEGVLESSLLRLDAADLRRAKLGGADLSGASLVGAVAQRTDFAGANLTGANAASANLHRASLAGASLAGASLSHANLEEADLTGADLADTSLTGVYAIRARFDGAQLDGADLTAGDFGVARWEGADLAGADVRTANLRGARGLDRERERRLRERGALTSVRPLRWLAEQGPAIQVAAALAAVASIAFGVWFVNDPVNRPVRDVLDDAALDFASGDDEEGFRRLERKLARPFLSRRERTELVDALVGHYLREGRNDAAATVLRDLIERYPDSTDVRVRRAACVRARGKRQE